MEWKPDDIMDPHQSTPLLCSVLSLANQKEDECERTIEFLKRFFFEQEQTLNKFSGAREVTRT